MLIFVPKSLTLYPVLFVSPLGYLTTRIAIMYVHDTTRHSFCCKIVQWGQNKAHSITKKEESFFMKHCARLPFYTVQSFQNWYLIRKYQLVYYIHAHNDWSISHKPLWKCISGEYWKWKISCEIFRVQ